MSGLDSAIAFFRAEQIDLFRSTCSISRATPGTFSPSTGEITPGTPTSVYSGACLARPLDWQGSDTQAGEREVRLRGIRLKILPDVAIEKDDEVTITSSPDPELVGRTFRITDVPRDDWQIVRVALCEEVT